MRRQGSRGSGAERLGLGFWPWLFLLSDLQRVSCPQETSVSSSIKWAEQSRLPRTDCALSPGHSPTSLPSSSSAQAWPDVGRRRNHVSQAGQRLDRSSVPSVGRGPGPAGSRFLRRRVLALERRSMERPRGVQAEQAQGGEWQGICVTTALGQMSGETWAPSPVTSDHLPVACPMTQPFGTHLFSRETFPATCLGREGSFPSR